MAEPLTESCLWQEPQHDDWPKAPSQQEESDKLVSGIRGQNVAMRTKPCLLPKNARTTTPAFWTQTILLCLHCEKTPIAAIVCYRLSPCSELSVWLEGRSKCVCPRLKKRGARFCSARALPGLSIVFSYIASQGLSLAPVFP